MCSGTLAGGSGRSSPGTSEAEDMRMRSERKPVMGSGMREWLRHRRVRSSIPGLTSGGASRCAAAPDMDARGSVLGPSANGSSGAGRNVLATASVADWAEAFLSLAALGTALRVFGLRRVARLLERLNAHAIVDASDPRVRHWVALVGAAADLQPFKARCLHQCLALSWILRRRGIAAEVVMGVRKFPFTAHVWLECGGEIIQWRAGMPEGAGPRTVDSLAVVLRIGAEHGCNGSRGYSPWAASVRFIPGPAV